MVKATVPAWSQDPCQSASPGSGQGLTFGLTVGKSYDEAGSGFLGLFVVRFHLIEVTA